MRELRAAVVAMVVFTLALGLAYPLAMTGAAQVVYPAKADGDARLLGSAQPDDLFQQRPSVTDYAVDATFFNNQGPNQLDLADQLSGYVAAYLEREQPFTPGLTRRGPAVRRGDDVGLGRRPGHLRENARIQANRVAERRGLDRAAVLELIDDAREPAAVRPRRSALDQRRRPQRRRGGRPMTDRPDRSLFEPAILRSALAGSLRKLDPREMARNPVMFVVEVGALFTSILWIVGETGQPGWFAFTVAVWLWLTVIFGNFAEAIAEGRGKAQAATLRAMRTETTATLRDGGTTLGRRAACAATSSWSRPAS